MDRITRKDCEQALRVYCERAGLPYGHYTHRIDNVPDGVTYGPTVEIEQNGRTYTAHEYATTENGKRHGYVITGGLALSGAYGGWEVQQIIGLDEWRVRHGDAKPCTGIRCPFLTGHRPAREVYNMLQGAIRGLELVDETRREEVK